VHENLNSDLPPLHGRQKQLTDVGEIGGAFGLNAILDDGGRELVGAWLTLVAVKMVPRPTDSKKVRFRVGMKDCEQKAWTGRC
jgi:hypothetical protein